MGKYTCMYNHMKNLEIDFVHNILLLNYCGAVFCSL